MPDASSSPTLADLATLAAALRHDRQMPDAERRALVRELAPALRPLADRPVGQLTAWAQAMAERFNEPAQVRQQALAAQAWVTLLTAGVGVLLGVGVALGVFYYDGSSRINVLAVLAVFVVLPVLLLLPTLVAMLPTRLARALPGVGPLSDLLRGLSVGRLAAAVGRVLPRGARDQVALSADTLGGGQAIYAHVQKWAVLTWSQVFAVMFSAAAIVTLMMLVVFSDLAFGWSTTLRIDAADVHRLTQTLAAPWAATGQAVPDLSLIATSRYYRLEAADALPPDPAALGAWWMFVVAAMACYGLGPRVVVLAVCLIARRRALRAAMLTMPGAGALRRRLHQGQVVFAGEGEGESDVMPGKADALAPSTEAPVADALIVWAAAPLDQAPGAWRASTSTRHHAGGQSSVAEDRAVIEGFAAKDGLAGVGVVVKAWEPPMGELLDFLRELREVLGQGVDITVLPVGDATTGQRDAWPKRLATLRDPWLRVVATDASASSADGEAAHA